MIVAIVSNCKCIVVLNECLFVFSRIITGYHKYSAYLNSLAISSSILALLFDTALCRQLVLELLSVLLAARWLVWLIILRCSSSCES